MTKKPKHTGRKASHWAATPNVFASALLQAATRHGADGEPDHEVGDLQQLVLAMWAEMTPAQHARFMRDEEWNSFIALRGTYDDYNAPPRGHWPTVQPVLVARFNVAGFTQAQLDALTGEIVVQGEESDDHPEAICTKIGVES